MSTMKKLKNAKDRLAQAERKCRAHTRAGTQGR